MKHTNNFNTILDVFKNNCQNQRYRPVYVYIQDLTTFTDFYVLEYRQIKYKYHPNKITYIPVILALIDPYHSTDDVEISTVNVEYFRNHMIYYKVYTPKKRPNVYDKQNELNEMKRRSRGIE